MNNFLTGLKNQIRTVSAILLTPPAPRLSPHCNNINALLLHLCDFDQALHMWVLRWLAFPLQNPGAKMSSCLLINGGEGTGKAMFFTKVMAALYGANGRVIGTNALHPHALGWAGDAKFVVVKGTYSDQSIGHLKHLISDSAIYMEARRAPGALMRNQMNFVFLTYELNFLPVHAENRRFVVIEAPPAQQARFYRAAVAEINDGGIEAFRHYLLNGVNLAGFNACTLPPAARIREAA